MRGELAVLEIMDVVMNVYSRDGRIVDRGCRNQADDFIDTRSLSAFTGNFVNTKNAGVLGF